MKNGENRENPSNQNNDNFGAKITNPNNYRSILELRNRKFPNNFKQNQLKIPKN